MSPRNHADEGVSPDPLTKWETRYRSGDVVHTPSSFVESIEPWLPRPASPHRARALDVAGGAGRHALWLAGRGFDVTLVDLSPSALTLAMEKSEAHGLRLTTLELDLETEPIPSGPWDVILCFHYLQRDLFPVMIDALAPKGLLAYAMATVRNLERNERPPLPFLLQPGEAPSLVGHLEIVYDFEGWTDSGRHEARVIARKTTHATEDQHERSAPGG